MRWLYDAVDKPPGVIAFDDLHCQLLDMAAPAKPSAGFTLAELRKSKLAPGVFGLLLNHNDMLIRRSTAEFSRSDVAL